MPGTTRAGGEWAGGRVQVLEGPGRAGEGDDDGRGYEDRRRARQEEARRLGAQVGGGQVRVDPGDRQAMKMSRR